MALVSHTVNTSDPMGERSVITGSVTMPDGDIFHIQLLPSSSGYVHSCHVSPGTELATDTLVACNMNTDLDEVNGAVMMHGATGATLYFSAIVSGGPF